MSKRFVTSIESDNFRTLGFHN